ncbi:E3 ubiquitin-protein ligase TRIM38-like [Hyalella azteca]|uniref:E3 ubiquitin-protein ligase TRIM38-like n=1 Tax=Hyalella azteca TaxID=294128 RepID=A0A8B7NKF0_HYAAZ|nr:E3 ubiquitin-protein ligase TRIM38-like [Hyalella azteca]
MASATIECDVCNEKFDSGNNKPLCLTCGHTFCFSCITNLQRLSGTQNCPKCRKPFSQRIDQMLVNYALIPSENKARPHPPSSLSEAPCLHQGKALDFLCMDCMELVCFTCIRGTHKNHEIELLDDLLQEDESVLNSWTKIRSTIHGKLGRVNNLVSVSDDILSLIDEIISLKTEFHGWKDSLLVQKVSTEQDLQVWDAPATGVIENKRHECKEMLCRLKLKPLENMELPEIRARLSAALKKCDSLQTYELPTFEDGVPWTVTSLAEGERAVASLANNIKPSRLVVLSTHTHPIPGLEELLYRLCFHHTGDISLLSLDCFWRPAGQSDGGLEAIIDKFSDRLDTMYGSPDQGLTYSHKRLSTGATRAEPCKVGIRFGSYFHVPVYLPGQIDDACCARGTSFHIRSYMRQYNGYSVTRWHFPDLCDEDLDWMIGILRRFNDSRLRVVLPRNGLTATGARRLFEELPQIREVYHDPGAAHLTSAGSGAPHLTFIKLSTNNIIQWL